MLIINQKFHPMSLEEYFLIVCFVQSIFVAVLLIKPDKNRLANILLSFWILTWGGMCYYRFMIFQDKPYILKYHYLLKINNVLYLMFFVFPFLYVKYICKSRSYFEKKDFFHFIPALLTVTALFSFFILTGEEKVRIMLSRPFYYRTLAVVFDYVVVVQGFVYVYFSLRYIREYHARIKENYSNIDNLTLYWLRNVIVIIFSVWLLGTLEYYLFDSYYMRMYYVNFMFAIIGLSIFYISYYMFNKRELFFRSDTVRFHPDYSPSVPVEINNSEQKDRKNDCLSDVYCMEVIEKLTAMMQTEKLYLNQNLNLEEVAQALSISRHHLSAILNNRLEISFFDFVNKYRIEEVKRMMHEPGSERLTLLAIAFDAGFNSKATFNRSFKKIEGMTPLEYRNRYVCLVS